MRELRTFKNPVNLKQLILTGHNKKQLYNKILANKLLSLLCTIYSFFLSLFYTLFPFKSCGEASFGRGIYILQKVPSYTMT